MSLRESDFKRLLVRRDTIRIEKEDHRYLKNGGLSQFLWLEHIEQLSNNHDLKKITVFIFFRSFCGTKKRH